MFDHISLGIADLARSRPFYDAALAPLGYTCLAHDATSLGYGANSVSLWLLRVSRPNPPNAESGLHFCLLAPTRGAVDAFHAAALAAGGTDNGTPGLRADYGPDYYAAFVIDPDGHRLEAYCRTAA